MAAQIHLDTHHHAGEIDRRIFSGFVEHMGRCVYEGIYDPDSPLADAQGFRTDVLAALAPLAMPLMRYPGGNFVSNYRWKDGVGPLDNRPARPDFAWRSIETNRFGVDEFMAWCAKAKTSAMLGLNLGTGDLNDVMDFVEYVNLDTPTYWADQRRANGHREPYGVKTWCLGNEMDGPWQAGHVPAEVYAQRARSAGAIIKKFSPGAETVACGSSGRGMPQYLEYDRIVLEHAWDEVDYISAHRYSNNKANDSAHFLAEGVEIDRVLADYDGLIKFVRGKKRSARNVYLSFDEWNVWYKNMTMDGQWTQAPHLIEEVYNLEDALVCAQYLAAFVRRADLVKIACIAQIVNIIAPILTKKDALLLQSIYYPFLQFSQNAKGLSLRPAIDCATYSAGNRGDVPVLDVAASYDAAGKHASVFLTHRDTRGPLEATIHFADLAIANVASAQVLTHANLKAANTWDAPGTIVPVEIETKLDGAHTLRITLPSQSFTTVTLQVG